MWYFRESWIGVANYTMVLSCLSYCYFGWHSLPLWTWFRRSWGRGGEEGGGVEEGQNTEGGDGEWGVDQTVCRARTTDQIILHVRFIEFSSMYIQIWLIHDTFFIVWCDASKWYPIFSFLFCPPLPPYRGWRQWFAISYHIHWSQITNNNEFRGFARHRKKGCLNRKLQKRNNTLSWLAFFCYICFWCSKQHKQIQTKGAGFPSFFFHVSKNTWFSYSCYSVFLPQSSLDCEPPF